MIRCNDCYRKLIKGHQETHNDNYNLCNKCYKRRFGVERRYIYKKESKRKYFRCSICNNDFPTNGAKIGNKCHSCTVLKDYRINNGKMKGVWEWVYDKIEDNNLSSLHSFKEKLEYMLMNFEE